MTRINLQWKNNEMVATQGSQRLASWKLLEADAPFQEWIDTYRSAKEQSESNTHLLQLGRRMFQWLDQSDGWFSQGLENTAIPLIVEVQIPKRNISHAQHSFVEAPWEVLADEQGFLAKEGTVQYCPVRRIGQPQRPRSASQFRLNTVFMASAPRNLKPELNFELEESTILNLHGNQTLQMDLFVEESGNLHLLREFIQEVQPVDVVHVSCHGNIDRSKAKPLPYLSLESELGEEEKVSAQKFAKDFGS